MTNTVATALSGLGQSVPFVNALAPRGSVIVLYHGVPPGGSAAVTGPVFEQHILFLKRHFDFVSPHDPERRRKAHKRIQVFLTFDDGFRNNAEVVAPILRKHRVPAEFFVSSRHSTPGKYLWFSYLRALEKHFPWRDLSFRGASFDMTVGERPRSVQRLWKMLVSLVPHPSAMYKAIEEELPQLEEFVGKGELADCYAGMTVDQVGEVGNDPLFSVGVHTIDHPFLTRCGPADALHQIEGNRAWLASACGRRCDAIAYPGGDYNPELINACREAGFNRGYVVARLLTSRSRLELPRIGIYSASTDVLGFKVKWGTLLRALRIPVG